MPSRSRLCTVLRPHRVAHILLLAHDLLVLVDGDHELLSLPLLATACPTGDDGETTTNSSVGPTTDATGPADTNTSGEPPGSTTEEPVDTTGECIALYEAYCQYGIEYSAMSYGEACGMALEELYACLSLLTCEEIADDTEDCTEAGMALDMACMAM